MHFPEICVGFRSLQHVTLCTKYIDASKHISLSVLQCQHNDMLQYQGDCQCIHFISVSAPSPVPVSVSMSVSVSVSESKPVANKHTLQSPVRPNK